MALIRRKGVKILCWRHHLDLYVAAFGCLSDLTGREYVRRTKRIFSAAATCPRCPYPGPSPFGDCDE